MMDSWKEGQGNWTKPKQYEPHHEKTCLQGFRPGKTQNRSAQRHKLATGVLKFLIQQVQVLYLLGSEQQRC